MATAIASIDACRLVEHLSKDRQGSKALSIWNAFILCLDDIDGEWAKGARADRARVNAAVRLFLSNLVDMGDQGAAKEEFRADLDQATDPIQVLKLWHSKIVADAPLPFLDHLDRFMMLYYLAQLTFFFGQLNIARDLAIRADAVLSWWNQTRSVALFKFLTATLILEIAVEFRDIRNLLDTKSEPMVFTLFGPEFNESPEWPAFVRELSSIGSPEFLSELPAPAPKGPGGPRKPTAIDNYLNYYWLPLETRRDLVKMDTEPNAPLALRYVLSRKLRAGRFHFWRREWAAARQVFEEIQEMATDSHGEPREHLESILLHARIHLGRIAARYCDFETSLELIGDARAAFKKLGNTFAEMKTMRYLAEAERRRNNLHDAEILLHDIYRICTHGGYADDRALASMLLGKIRSQTGFQHSAMLYFTDARRVFRGNLRVRETLDCQFWHAAAAARWQALDGLPTHRATEAELLVRVYEAFHVGVQALAEGEGGDLKATEKAEVKFLHERSSLGTRRPGLVRVLLALRTGHIPDQTLIDDLTQNVSAGPDPRQPVQGDENQLTSLLLRVVRLQCGLEAPVLRDDADCGVNDLLTKFRIRSALVSAFESVARSGDSCQELCDRFVQIDAVLRRGKFKAGLVPFFVDFSQYFVDRSCYVAAIIRIGYRIQEVLESPRATQRPKFSEALKRVARSITKYLVLEHTFYMAPPPFADCGRSPALWRKLNDPPETEEAWKARYEYMRRGYWHGLSYPPDQVGLGWVEDFTQDTATLRIVWADDRRWEGIQSADDFEAIDVEVEVLRRGHATAGFAPVVLVGRSGEFDGGSGDWIAHHIPDLERRDLFEGADEDEPRLSTWNRILEGLSGRRTREKALGTLDEERLERDYAKECNGWFGARLSTRVFEKIFKGVKHDPSLGYEESAVRPPASFIVEEAAVDEAEVTEHDTEASSPEPKQAQDKEAGGPVVRSFIEKASAA